MELPPDHSTTICKGCNANITEFRVVLHDSDAGPMWQAECVECGTKLGFIEERNIGDVFGGLAYES